MADGSIEFSTTLDNSDLEAKLKDAENKIDDLKRKIESKTAERNGIAEQMKQANEEINRARESIEKLKQRREELNASGGTSGQFEAISNEIDKEITSWEQQNAVLDKLQSKLFAVDDEVEGYTNSLKSAESEYNKLGNEAQRQAKKSSGAFVRASTGIKTAMASAATNVRSSFSSLGKSISSPFDTLERKLVGSLKKVFVFSMIVKGVKALKSEIGSMAEKNEQFTSSVENLKAVMGGVLSQIVAAVLPAVISVVNFIASVFESIAGLIDAIFGSNLSGAIAAARNSAGSGDGADAANDMADAQDKQAKSAKNLAKEQKKANEQVMGFDELNKLAAESSSDAADSGYSTKSDEASGGLAGFTPDLGMFDGLFKKLDELKNRLLNDVEGPFAQIREGLLRIKTGFGELVQGISTGDWGLAWKGVTDIVVGALTVMEGIIGGFLDWFDSVTGGQFHEAIEGIKRAIHGVVEVVEGIMTGDLGKVLQGVFDIVEGIEGAFDGLVNWLDGVTKGNFHTIFEGMKETMHGVVEFIEGVLTGDLDKAIQGIAGIFNGLVDMISGQCETIYKMATEMVDKLFKWLEEKFPDLAPMLESVKATVKSVIDGIHEIVTKALEGLKQVFEGKLDVIVGIFTGDADKIARGLKKIVNGLATMLEGALNGLLDGAFGLINGAIDGLNNIPGVDIPHISPPRVSIPRLAAGAVIPPNREFLAVLGDQRSGTNIETPESLMRQVFREEMASALLQMSPTQGGDVVLELRVDGETIAQAVSKGNASLARRGMLKPQISF